VKDASAPASPRIVTFDAGERQAWLAAAGPHALLARELHTPSQLIFAVALRPGTLTNTISEVWVVIGAEKVPIPVFDVYAQQWQLDLVSGIGWEHLAGAGPWETSVEYLDDAGSHTLPIHVAQPQLTSFDPVEKGERWLVSR
jgi:hypothetical protein